MSHRLQLLLVPTILIALASSAFAQWMADGTPLCSATNAQRFPVIVSDGTGGAIVAWQDERTVGNDVYVQRLSATGIGVWGKDGIPLYVGSGNQQDLAMVPDGTGGAIVAWVDYRDQATNGADIYCRRVSKNGIPLWNANAVPLCTAAFNQPDLALVSDGAGGAIATWRDFRNGVDYDVYAQRVNASGAVQWATNGVAIATETEDQTIPSATTDGAGGAIIAWFDRRSSPNADVYAQRVNQAGVAQWAEDGVPVCTRQGVQRNPVLVPDGAGGAIITWYDSRGGFEFDVYCQHLSSTGVSQWTADGVGVCTLANEQVSPLALADDAGGAIIVWYDLRSDIDYDLYAQRFDGAGNALWTTDGVKLCGAPGEQFDATVTDDGSHGVIVTWTDFRDEAMGTFDIYAQHVTESGVPDWTTDGVVLCGAPDEQGYSQSISDAAGGALVVWGDYRSGSDSDIYALRVLSDGSIPIPTSIGARAPLLRAGEFFPNPFAGSASLDLEVDDASELRIEVYDVAGHAVRSAILPGAAGTRRVTFDGRDDDGRLLPSGVYFCRLQARGETLTRKMVIAR